MNRRRKPLPTATNILTLVVVLAWVGSMIGRAFDPTWPGSAAADAGLLLVLGYWFSSTARRSREESGS